MKTVKKLLVVGGGTAGLVTAIILKKKLDIQIDIVCSKNIGIIGVGEGTTEHWREFMQYAGIDQYTLIKETDATYKVGIMFHDWTSKNYMHCVASPLDSRAGQYHHVYAKMMVDDDLPLNPKSFWENKIDINFLNHKDAFPANQFHFNTFKLSEFLTKFAKSIGVNVYEDDILDLKLDEHGYIDSIVGEFNNYKYDFYIDSTGFKRFLISKLGGKWQSYSKYLKMKSAIVFQNKDEENYNFWTLAKAMNYGWMFRIPVWGRYGNGYVFDSDYITAEQAHKELEEYFKYPIEIKRSFNFDPGALEQCWIKNCCAVGVSANFVEPLEASSIGTTIQQAFLLMHKIGRYNENSIKSYNKSVNDIMNNIRDFICLHYITEKQTTDLWKDLKKMPLPDTLAENLELWKHRLPISEDFNNLSDYILFKDSNFLVVMEGLGLLDKNSINDEYQILNSNYKQHAADILSSHRIGDANLNLISHKEYIKIIREKL
jgi:flavin-dependent dehydrogenase